MEQIKLQNSGLTFILDGTRYESSGPEGVTESGSMATDGKTDDEIWKMADKHFMEYLMGHRIEETEHDSIIKRVAYDKNRGDYIQLQAIKTGEADYYIVQEYNTDMVFLREQETDAWNNDDIEKYLSEKYDIQNGLIGWVYRSDQGDCTNKGISSKNSELYILGCKTAPFYPRDIRQCVQIVKREVMGEHYVNAKPIVHPKRWYMAGGNFLYTSDRRYEEITGICYPISIHDRHEVY